MVVVTKITLAQIKKMAKLIYERKETIFSVENIKFDELGNVLLPYLREEKNNEMWFYVITRRGDVLGHRYE